MVVAPKRIAEFSWSDEVKNWEHLYNLKIIPIKGNAQQRAKALKEDALIYTISRDNISWLYEALKREKKLKYFDMLVLDELSSFKNNQTARFRYCKLLRENVKRCVGLTGTLIPNGYKDVFAQSYLLDRGFSFGRYKTPFLERYFIPTKRKGVVIYDWKLKQGAEKEIQEKLKGFCISMQKEDYLNLKEAIYIKSPIELSPSEMKLYKDYERDAVLSLDSEELTSTSASSLSNALSQMAGGALYLADEEGKEQRAYKEIHRAKLDYLSELVEASDSSVLIAYQFKHEKERILHELKSYKPLELKTSDDLDKWNSGEHKVLIGHPASIGHGLNLQKGGSVIVWYSLPWSLELYEQFNARLHRQGQKRSVKIYHLIAKGTIDERVYTTLKSKASTQTAMMQALKEIIKTNKTKN